MEKQTVELTASEYAFDPADLSVDGEYELYCPIDGQRDEGMEGKLVVGGSWAGAGTSTGDRATTEDSDYGG